MVIDPIFKDYRRHSFRTDSITGSNKCVCSFKTNKCITYEIEGEGRTLIEMLWFGREKKILNGKCFTSIFC